MTENMLLPDEVVKNNLRPLSRLLSRKETRLEVAAPVPGSRKGTCSGKEATRRRWHTLTPLGRLSSMETHNFQLTIECSELREIVRKVWFGRKWFEVKGMR